MATDMNGVTLGPTPPGVPHLAVPFSLALDGSAAVLEQDSDAEIVQSVGMIVGTVPGTRLVVPAFGMPDPAFSGVDMALLQATCGRWEKRATVEVQVTPGGTERVAVAVKGVS